MKFQLYQDSTCSLESWKNGPYSDKVSSSKHPNEWWFNGVSNIQNKTILYSIFANHMSRLWWMIKFAFHLSQSNQPTFQTRLHQDVREDSLAKVIGSNKSESSWIRIKYGFCPSNYLRDRFAFSANFDSSYSWFVSKPDELWLLPYSRPKSKESCLKQAEDLWIMGFEVAVWSRMNLSFES